MCRSVTLCIINSGVDVPMSVTFKWNTESVPGTSFYGWGHPIGSSGMVCCRNVYSRPFDCFLALRGMVLDGLKYDPDSPSPFPHHWYWVLFTDLEVSPDCLSSYLPMLVELSTIRPSVDTHPRGIWKVGNLRGTTRGCRLSFNTLFLGQRQRRYVPLEGPESRSILISYLDFPSPFLRSDKIGIIWKYIKSKSNL